MPTSELKVDKQDLLGAFLELQGLGFSVSDRNLPRVVILQRRCPECALRLLGFLSMLQVSSCHHMLLAEVTVPDSMSRLAKGPENPLLLRSWRSLQGFAWASHRDDFRDPSHHS